MVFEKKRLNPSSVIERVRLMKEEKKFLKYEIGTRSLHVINSIAMPKVVNVSSNGQEQLVNQDNGHDYFKN